MIALQSSFGSTSFSIADLDNLPDPDVLAEEIVENLESALEGFRAIIASLNAGKKEAIND